MHNPNHLAEHDAIFQQLLALEPNQRVLAIQVEIAQAQGELQALEHRTVVQAALEPLLRVCRPGDYKRVDERKAELHRRIEDLHALLDPNYSFRLTKRRERVQRLQSAFDSLMGQQDNDRLRDIVSRYLRGRW